MVRQNDVGDMKEMMREEKQKGRDGDRVFSM